MMLKILCLFVAVASANFCTLACKKTVDKSRCATLCDRYKHYTMHYKRSDSFQLDSTITGSDVQAQMRHTTVMFSLKNGTVVSYDKQGLHAIADIAALDPAFTTDASCGLLDVAITPQYLKTNIVFVTYTRRVEERLTQVLAYFNTSARVLTLFHAEKLADCTIQRGGWIDMPQGHINRLFASFGGNPHHLDFINEKDPHLSTILRFNLKADLTQIAPSNVHMLNNIWAAGIDNAIACTRHRHFKTQMFCLNVNHNGKRELLTIDSLTNYGTASKEHTCRHVNPLFCIETYAEKRAIAMPTEECAVTDLAMDGTHPVILVDSCNGLPTRVFRLNVEEWVPVDIGTFFLKDSKFLHGAKTSRLLISGRQTDGLTHFFIRH